MSAKLSAGGSLALIALCIFGAANSFAEVAEIKIARQFGISFLPLHVMQDKKLFEKHAKAAGLDTQATYLQIAGGASQNDALLSGSIHIAGGGIPPLAILWARTKGTPNEVKAIAAKKHIYCEKPSATTSAEALALYNEVTAAGLKNGVVQDKLWLPGLLKLKYLIDTGFFGQIISVRGEFGYWVFTGEHEALQRPSWNYRKEDDGGIIVDMLCHWQYVIQNLFGDIKSVACLGATHVPQRWDEKGKPYKVTADDSAYATFELHNGVVCQFNSSWCVRVRRDDLLTLQVDGTMGAKSTTKNWKQAWAM